jgi:hypothetical protein
VAQSHRTRSLDPRDLVLSDAWMARCLAHQGSSATPSRCGSGVAS